MTFAEAATLPVVYFTVHHALERLARLQAGETVLVHGAAGGIGLAALQLARARGAHVIATAGTPVKRDLLRMLGVRHVLDSRTWTSPSRSATSPAGRASTSSSTPWRERPSAAPWNSCARAGASWSSASAISTPPPRWRCGNNIAFFGVDAYQLISGRLPQAGICFDETAQLIADGTYRPLLHMAYPATRIGEALRVLQRSRHLGKVIITFEEPPPLERIHPPLQLSPQATYLVTGGLSGLGAAVAHRLVDHGARHLALLGRRGCDTPGASQLIQTLAERGVTATAHAADVTREEDLRRTLATIDAEGDPDAAHRLDTYARRLSELPGVQGLRTATGTYLDGKSVGARCDPTAADVAAKHPGAPVRRFTLPSGTWLAISSTPRPYSAAATDVLHTIRAQPAPAPTLTGGATADFLDTRAAASGNCPQPWSSWSSRPWPCCPSSPVASFCHSRPH